MVRNLTKTAMPASDQRLMDAVERLGRLPVLSATVRRVQVIAASEDAGIGDMVAALEADQGLATDLLRYANSAACARPLRARSIRAAVTLVGRKAIAQLAIEAATYRFFARAPGNGGRSIGHLHLHAAAVAGTAQAIADRTGANTDITHLGGLLHDVGKLVMPLAFGDEALDAIAAEHQAGAARAAAERKLLGVDHAEAGALVARASQVEEPVELVIAFHHGGPDGRQVVSPEAAEPGRRARVDALTGALNRRHWMATVRRAVADQEPGSVLICDIDHFKAVNDGHGHATGDLVLTEVARHLAAQGVVGRLGGDEFAVWIPGGPRRGDEAPSALPGALAAA